MAGQLIFPSGSQFQTALGVPWALAEAYFYDAGTTTPSNTYDDSTLASAHPNPVVADAKGLFPAIFADPDIPLRVKIIQAAGNVGSPEIDIDNVSNVLEVTAGMLAPGAVVDHLGYTPVNPASDTEFTGNISLNQAALSTLSTLAMGFRGVPLVTKNVSYELTLDDVGKRLMKSDTGSYTYTIPPNSGVEFPLGSTIWVVNGNTSNLTIARGSGVALRAITDPTFTDANMVLAPGEACLLYKYGPDSWDAWKFNYHPSVAYASIPGGVQGVFVNITDLGGGEGHVAYDGTSSKYYRVRTEGYGVIATDAAATWTPFTSAPSIRHTGTLTADRTIIMATTNAYAGMIAKFARTGGGSFNLSIGGLKNLVTDTWCEVTFDGSAWYLSAYGAL